MELDKEVEEIARLLLLALGVSHELDQGVEDSQHKEVKGDEEDKASGAADERVVTKEVGRGSIVTKVAEDLVEPRGNDGVNPIIGVRELSKKGHGREPITTEGSGRIE